MTQVLLAVSLVLVLDRLGSANTNPSFRCLSRSQYTTEHILEDLNIETSCLDLFLPLFSMWLV